MSSLRILLVEDEERLADMLRRGLESEGYGVEVVHDGASALTFLDRGQFDIVVLDRDLPMLHGDIVARTLRDAQSPVRILMLTASGDTKERIEGLQLGADDYLSKPFDYDELLARLDAMGRRLAATQPGLRHGAIRVDTTARRAWLAEEPLQLRPKELAVLTELVRARGGILSPSELVDRVWDEADGVGDGVLKTVIHSLRKKLGADAIVTAPGFGYRLE